MIQTATLVIGGNEYPATLTTQDDGSVKCAVSSTAPLKSSYNQPGGYYNAVLRAADAAGNESTADTTHAAIGNDLKLVVREKNPPTVAITYPGDGAYINTATPNIRAQLRDDDSGVNTDTISLHVNGKAVPAASITKTEVEGGYDISYQVTDALPDRDITISLAVADNDGNICDVVTITAKISTAIPTATIENIQDGMHTNQSKLTVNFTANDDDKTSVTITITDNGEDAGPVTYDTSTGRGSKEITLEEEGEHVITLRVVDALNNVVEVARTIHYDITPPSFISAEITPNPVEAGKPFELVFYMRD